MEIDGITSEQVGEHVAHYGGVDDVEALCCGGCGWNWGCDGDVGSTYWVYIRRHV